MNSRTYSWRLLTDDGAMKTFIDKSELGNDMGTRANVALYAMLMVAVIVAGHLVLWDGHGIAHPT